MNRIFACAMLGLVLTHESPICAQAAKATASGPVERVTAGNPVRKNLVLTTVQPGAIKPFEEAPLHPKVTGYVELVLVDIGDRVAKGDLLITISVPELEDAKHQQEALFQQAEAEVLQSEAAVKAAQAASRVVQSRLKGVEAGLMRARGDFDRWNAEYTRIKELAARGTVTEKLVDESLNQLRSADAARTEAEIAIQSAAAEVEQSDAHVIRAEADLAAARARVGVARANLQHAQTMLTYSQLKAPFHGVVTQRSVDPGHLVQPGNGAAANPLLWITRMDPVRVVVDVPETEAPLVSLADPVTITVQALSNGTFTGNVSRTGWSLNAANRSLRTEIDIPNTDGLLRPGMFARVEVRLEERLNALVLPAAAIVREGMQMLCCVVEHDQIERRPVQVGIRSGDEVEILSGVSESDTVVLIRAGNLKQGQPVELIAQGK